MCPCKANLNYFHKKYLNRKNSFKARNQNKKMKVSIYTIYNSKCDIDCLYSLYRYMKSYYFYYNLYFILLLILAAKHNKRPQI